MTTFEITITTLLALIAFALIFRDFVIGKALDRIIHNQDVIQKYTQCIEVNTHHASSVLKGHIAPDVEIISNNFPHLLDEGVGLPALVDIVDKMHKNLCVEIADKMVDRVYKQPTSVNGTPCYAPDGICTNPCRDCINCPKRGTGGTWSTNISIKAEDTPLQEFFNDNKEDKK